MPHVLPSPSADCRCHKRLDSYCACKLDSFHIHCFLRVPTTHSVRFYRRTLAVGSLKMMESACGDGNMAHQIRLMHVIEVGVPWAWGFPRVAMGGGVTSPVRKPVCGDTRRIFSKAHQLNSVIPGIFWPKKGKIAMAPPKMKQ